MMTPDAEEKRYWFGSLIMPLTRSQTTRGHDDRKRAELIAKRLRNGKSILNG